MTYTRAQLAALAWLPTDGSAFGWFSTGCSPRIADEQRKHIQSLKALHRRQLVGWDDDCVWLTAAGVAERARLVEKGEIG